MNEEASYFLDHSSSYQGESGHKWVASSGIEGAQEINLVVKPTAMDQIKYGFPTLGSADDATETPEGEMGVIADRFNVATGNNMAALRFGSIPVPKGAKVKAAWIQFTAGKSKEDETKVTIWGEAADDAERYASKLKNISERSKTSSSIDWEIQPWIADEHNDAEKTPDLTSIVQEIVNRDGWKPGNAIAFIIHGKGNVMPSPPREQSRVRTPVCLVSTSKWMTPRCRKWQKFQSRPNVLIL
ncbi:MAG: hypothetical protein R3C11_08500 [Planctomycetaceae bacterium]